MPRPLLLTLRTSIVAVTLVPFLSVAVAAAPTALTVTDTTIERVDLRTLESETIALHQLPGTPYAMTREGPDGDLLVVVGEPGLHDGEDELFRVDPETGVGQATGLLLSPAPRAWSVESVGGGPLYGADARLLYELVPGGATRTTVLEFPAGTESRALAATTDELYVVLEELSTGFCGLYLVDLEGALLGEATPLPQCGDQGAAIADGKLYLVEVAPDGGLINPPSFTMRIHSVDLDTELVEELGTFPLERLDGITDVRGPAIIEVPVDHPTALWIVVGSIALAGSALLRRV